MQLNFFNEKSKEYASTSKFVKGGSIEETLLYNSTFTDNANIPYYIQMNRDFTFFVRLTTIL